MKIVRILTAIALVAGALSLGACASKKSSQPAPAPASAYGYSK